MTKIHSEKQTEFAEENDSEREKKGTGREPTKSNRSKGVG